MHRSKIERHESMHGPHFDETCAKKVVAKMQNEDGSKGAHWTIEETTQVAAQYGVNLKGDKYNKYDWYVALNMVYSDFYRAIVTITGSNSIKAFVELAKAWLNDKDIEEGKMWYYFKYIICEEFREGEYEDEYEARYRASNMRRGGARYHSYAYDDEYDDEDDDEYGEESNFRRRGMSRSRRISRY